MVPGPGTQCATSRRTGRRPASRLRTWVLWVLSERRPTRKSVGGPQKPVEGDANYSGMNLVLLCSCLLGKPQLQEGWKPERGGPFGTEAQAENTGKATSPTKKTPTAGRSPTEPVYWPLALRPLPFRVFKNPSAWALISETLGAGVLLFLKLLNDYNVQPRLRSTAPRQWILSLHLKIKMFYLDCKYQIQKGLAKHESHT